MNTSENGLQPDTTRNDLPDREEPQPRITVWEHRMGEDEPHLIGTVTPPAGLAALPEALEGSLTEIWRQWREEVWKQGDEADTDEEFLKLLETKGWQIVESDEVVVLES